MAERRHNLVLVLVSEVISVDEEHYRIISS